MPPIEEEINWKDKLTLVTKDNFKLFPNGQWVLDSMVKKKCFIATPRFKFPKDTFTPHEPSLTYGSRPSHIACIIRPFLADGVERMF